MQRGRRLPVCISASMPGAQGGDDPCGPHLGAAARPPGHPSHGSKKFGPALVNGAGAREVSREPATAPFPQSRHCHPRVSTSHTTSPAMAVSSASQDRRSCSSRPNNRDWVSGAGSGDGPPEMLLLRDRRPPARSEEEPNGPAQMNGKGRQKFQCLVAVASQRHRRSEIR